MIENDKTAITYQRQGLFEQELSHFAELSSGEGSVQGALNITENRLESYLPVTDVVTARVGDTYVQAIQNFTDSAVDTMVGEEIRLALAGERVLTDHGCGKTNYRCVFLRRRGGGGCFWGSTRVRTYLNPDSGGIVAFLYATDVTEQKLREQLLHQITRLDYEMLTEVDIYHDTYRVISLEHEKEMTVGQRGDLRKAAWESVEYYVEEKVRKEYLEKLNYTYIKKQLEKAPVRSFAVEEHDSQGGWRVRWFQLFYMEKATGIACIARSDATGVVRKKQRQKEKLASALVAAKQASTAKSDLLSRMSHEVHTPTNAIIGMSTIAAQSLGDDEQVADCTAKTDIPSRFLLSLINDVLDMNRIESGKMLLENEKTPFRESLRDINVICYARTEVEGVDYECIIAPVVDDYYIGGAMKLQQVPINILNNAIKFTGESGKVTFSVGQRKRTENDAMLRSVASDAGVGMNKDFLSCILKPFSRESARTVALYGGTGLGLAISKDIVDLMNGWIVVYFIKGIGTEFTVDVKLGVAEKEKLCHHQKKQNYNFSHLKILVMNDDMVVYEGAMLTLRKIGIEAEWVDSGRKVIERVSVLLQDGKYFDLILIGWKMPEMDGIETVRRIRKMVGPDVIIIIMTAYDWASIEHEAKLAGANLLMGKFMFKSALISAFPKVLSKKEGQTRQPEAADYNSSGKRAFLAKDNTLNTEVVAMLLKNEGFAAETVKDDLRTMEMFSKSEEGYYGAILMDIRMPLIDGLTATTSIRHLNNEDAAEIPIVAMTANAFDNDVEKSRTAGMDVYLAKPIDPEQMYRAPYDLIYRRED